MQKRMGFISSVLILLVISVIILLLYSFGLLKGIGGFFESATVPLQRAVFGMPIWRNESEELKLLREENLILASQIVNQEKINNEIAALRDQFDTPSPASRELMPAKIIGRNRGFLIIDKGSRDGIKRGDNVVFKDNLIGVIDRVSTAISKVKLITHDSMVLTAQAVDSKSIGVIKGQGTNLILENVVLTEKLKKGELVITRGDIDEKKLGINPDLIVGKIVDINKRESALFQNAEVESLVDFASLRMVFILTTNNK